MRPCAGLTSGRAVFRRPGKPTVFDLRLVSKFVMKAGKNAINIFIDGMTVKVCNLSFFLVFCGHFGLSRICLNSPVSRLRMRPVVARLTQERSPVGE